MMLALVGVVLLLLAPVVAAADAALAALGRERLHELGDRGDTRAERLAALLARRADLHLALRVSGHALLGAAAVALLPAVLNAVPLWRLTAPLFFVLCGELLPRRLGVHDPERVALRLWWVCDVVWRLWRPLFRWVLRSVALAEPPAQVGDEEDDGDGDEAVLDVAEAARLHPERRRRIEEILAFGDRAVEAVMVPRVDMVSVAADATLGEAAELATRSGRSRLPVIGETPDEVIGVLHARDLLGRLADGGGLAGELARPALFVGESARLDQALRELRKARTALAVVVDEYGGTAGLVTIEDLVEEIVGEIHDESDPGVEHGPRPRPEGGWWVPGRMELAELCKALELEPPDEPAVNTVAGLALSLAGDLPQEGEVLVWETEAARLLLLIAGVEGRRVVDTAVLVQSDGASEEELAQATAKLPEETGEGSLLVEGDVPLCALEAWLGYDEVDGGRARVADLFAFWPAGSRHGRGVLWRRHRATAVEQSGRPLHVEWRLAVEVGSPNRYGGLA